MIYLNPIQEVFREKQFMPILYLHNGNCQTVKIKRNSLKN